MAETRPRGLDAAHCAIRQCRHRPRRDRRPQPRRHRDHSYCRPHASQKSCRRLPCCACRRRQCNRLAGNTWSHIFRRECCLQPHPTSNSAISRNAHRFDERPILHACQSQDLCRKLGRNVCRCRRCWPYQRGVGPWTLARRTAAVWEIPEAPRPSLGQFAPTPASALCLFDIGYGFCHEVDHDRAQLRIGNRNTLRIEISAHLPEDIVITRFFKI